MRDGELAAHGRRVDERERERGMIFSQFLLINSALCKDTSLLFCGEEAIEGTLNWKNIKSAISFMGEKMSFGIH